MVSAGRHTVSQAVRIGPLPKMAEIGVERFRAGHHQKHGAERKQADIAVAQQEAGAVKRIERREHGRIERQMVEAGGGQCDKPDERDRPEKDRDLRRAVRLHHEQRKQDHDR